MNKFLRITAFGILASMLALAGPSGPALAAYDEEISLDPDAGEIGDYIYVSGNDFEASGNDPEDYVYIRIYLTHEEAEPGDDIDSDIENYEVVESSVFVDDDGEFEDARFTIPDELTDGEDDIETGGGTYYVCLTYTDDDRIVATAELTVIAGEIAIDPDEDVVGAEIDISGERFSDDEELSVEFDSEEVAIASGDEQVGADGEFELTFIVPESTAGEHTVTVYGDEGSQAEAPFTTVPQIDLSPLTAPPGDPVTISGTGFGNRLRPVTGGNSI